MSKKNLKKMKDSTECIICQNIHTMSRSTSDAIMGVQIAANLFFDSLAAVFEKHACFEAAKIAFESAKQELDASVTYSKEMYVNHNNLHRAISKHYLELLIEADRRVDLNLHRQYLSLLDEIRNIASMVLKKQLELEQIIDPIKDRLKMVRAC